MIRKIYKYISDALMRRRYLKLYHRLFWFYAERYSTADEAGINAAEAFEWLTLNEWPEWAKLNLHEFLLPK